MEYRQLGQSGLRISVLSLGTSLQARDAEYELIPITLDQGLGILVWSPLPAGSCRAKIGAASRARKVPVILTTG